MENILAFGMPGGSEWIIILLVVLLLFGAKRLPELAIREAMREEEIKKVEAKPQPEVRAEESAQKSETK